MKYTLTTAFVFLLMRLPAQVSINLDTAVIITFSSTLTGVSTGTFTGGGFQAFPGTGKLSSHAWSVLGFSSGDLGFGGAQISGRLAMGNTTLPNPVTDVGATVGGIYAYTGSPFTDHSLLVQPTDIDCTPGSIILKIVNDYPSGTIYLLDIDYDLWIRNNTPTSNKVSFSWSEDASTYTAVPSLDYTSPAAATSTGIVSTGAHSFTIIGCDVTPGEFMYLKWSFSDVSGTGERDEFYFDDISVSATNLLPITLTSFTASAADAGVELNWTTAAEINTAAFIIQRKTTGENIFSDIGSLDASGNSTTPIYYTFTDDAPANGINYYRLRENDIDGNFSFSKSIAVQYGDAGNDVALYPNPAGDFITISSEKLKNTNAVIKIFDAAGKIISLPLINTGENAFTYSSRSLPEGIYAVSISSGNEISIGRFVKMGN